MCSNDESANNNFKNNSEGVILYEEVSIKDEVIEGFPDPIIRMAILFVDGLYQIKSQVVDQLVQESEGEWYCFDERFRNFREDFFARGYTNRAVFHYSVYLIKLGAILHRRGAEGAHRLCTEEIRFATERAGNTTQIEEVADIMLEYASMYKDRVEVNEVSELITTHTCLNPCANENGVVDDIEENDK